MTNAITQKGIPETPVGCKQYLAFSYHDKVRKLFIHALPKGESYEDYKEESTPGSRYNVVINRVGADQKYSLEDAASHSANKEAQAKLGASVGPAKFGAEASLSGKKDEMSKTSHKAETKGGGDLIKVNVSGGKNGGCCSGAGGSSIKIFLIVRLDREQIEAQLNLEMKGGLAELTKKFEELARIQGQNKQELDEKLSQAKTALKAEYDLKLRSAEQAREQAQRGEIGGMELEEIAKIQGVFQEELGELKVQKDKEARRAERERDIAIQNKKALGILLEAEEAERAAIEHTQFETTAQKLQETLFQRERFFRTEIKDLSIGKIAEMRNTFYQERIDKLQRDVSKYERFCKLIAYSGEESEGREKIRDASQEEFNRLKAKKIANEKMEREEIQAQLVIKTEKVPPMAFGAAEWAKYFGDVGVEPPLPSDIKAILNGPCPIWSGKKLYETHLLTLIPQTVNGRPLTLKLLEELIQKPLQGNVTKYERFYLGKYTDPPAPASHWALMTHDVLPSSRSKSYSDQQALVPRLYAVPSVLDATVTIALEYVRTGKRLYSSEPLTYTRCQEKYDKDWQLVVGGFAPAGLDVSRSGWGDDGNGGLGVLREF